MVSITPDVEVARFASVSIVLLSSGSSGGSADTAGTSIR